MRNKYSCFKIIFSFIFVIGLMSANSLNAFGLALVGEDDAPYKGEGTEQSPYVYLINDEAKVTWKHLNDIRDGEIYEIYEKRSGDEEDGELEYSWQFPHDDRLDAEGPYFLGINFYEGDIINGLPGGENAVYFSFANKRDFAGRAVITINIAHAYADGQTLYLYYYGGYDSSIVHGNSPVIMPDEIQDSDGVLKEEASELAVENGFVTFSVRSGGNYFLTNEKITNLNFEYDGNGNQETVIQYDAEQVLGTISSLFSDAAVAQAVAGALGKTVDDTVKQGDIDSIQKLYIGEGELEDTKDLEKIYFARLETLTITGNKLESIGVLNMPMLTYLDLSDNSLRDVNNVFRISTLRTLNLSGNELTVLPELDGLPELQTLDISDNKLETIMKISSESLRYINASCNSLLKPVLLDGCPNLESISLDGQLYEASIKFDGKSDIKIDPAPDILKSQTDEAEVSILDSNGEVIEKTDYDALVSDGYIISADKLKKADKVMIYGYDAGGEVFGEYSYILEKNADSVSFDNILIIAGAVFIILTAVLIFIIKRKNSHGNNEKKDSK